jgi:TonB-like protein
MQVMVLEDTSIESPTLRRSLPPLTLMAVDVTDADPNLPSSTLSPDAASGSAQADGPSGLGTMYGRYLGQIHARIDRAWRRPRTAIGAPIFQCQVQLDQDSSGRVEEVTLLECNGDTSWQVSLVQAIEAASPLPAPPTPAVFAPHVLVAFRATAYTPAAPAELYQSPTAVAVNDAPGERDSQSQNAFQALREAAQAQKPGAIGLRIEGSKVEVEPDRQ